MTFYKNQKQPHLEISKRGCLLFLPSKGGISIDPYANYGKKGTKFEKMAEDRLMQHDLYPEKVDNR